MGGRGRFRFYPPLRAIADLTDAWSERVQEVLLRRVSTMSLACLVCRSVDSPSRSFRSHSVSSSEDEGQCAAVVSCLTRKVTIAATGGANAVSTSKVTPFPVMASGQGMGETPRLLRSRAVSRDLVRDWNFDQVHVEG
ncbi:hypothetical protein MUK42_16534 [Musa troglodytarum]|uniref:Uncharacterized protein n=1 Tax=Musa troglodytarum TaxID=320322 RepID=A0A9E7HIX8_9LILI|nr:hypothetical protein MUK42_16534 [Musa troglodytarum]